MIALLGLSMLLSGIITYSVFKGLQYYYRHHVLAEDQLAQTRNMIRSMGDINFFLIVFVPLSIMFFFFLTKPYAGYFREISKGIHQLSAGNFTNVVHISSNDEFAAIAAEINLASERLQSSVERGDFAESSKDQLVLNLAHDLRTPLTSVLGYLDFMLRDEALTAEQIRHYTTIAFAKSKRLEKLIDELFEITRMNYGMLTLHKQPIDLGELLRQLSEEAYPLFEKHHLTARLNVEPQLETIADGELLARVFENLLNNAARYGDDGQFIDLNARLEGDEIVIQVINYGASIPENELPHLFDMFYTGDQSRTHREGSTGLGLFIAKNIVERHNGTISAESNLIRTVFEVRIPR